MIIHVPARTNTQCLYSLAKELSEKKLVKINKNGKYELTTYGKKVDAWRQFAHYQFKPALFRSTVFRADGETVHMWPSLTKTPNLGELDEETQKKIRPVVAYRKVDGSLVSVSYDPEEDQLMIRSKGSWNNFVTEGFRKFIELNELEEQLVRIAERVNKDGLGTVHFELVCAIHEDDWKEVAELAGIPASIPLPRDGKIIETPHSAISKNAEYLCLKSGETGCIRAYLLMAKQLTTNGIRLYTPEEFDWPYKPWKIQPNDFAELTELVEEKPNEEGVMTWVSGFELVPACGYPIDPIVKVKNKNYVFMVSGKGTLFALLTYVWAGGRDDILAMGEIGRKIVELAEELDKLEAELLDFREKVLNKQCFKPPKGPLRNVVEAETEKEARRLARRLMFKLLENGTYDRLNDIIKKNFGKIERLRKRMQKHCPNS